jgi:hypothetical protein
VLTCRDVSWLLENRHFNYVVEAYGDYDTWLENKTAAEEGFRTRT